MKLSHQICNREIFFGFKDDETHLLTSQLRLPGYLSDSQTKMNAGCLLNI